MEDLKKAIQEGNVESFNEQLQEVEEIFQNEEHRMKMLAQSGTLCYAASVGSIQMLDTLIQKGVGKA